MYSIFLDGLLGPAQ